MPRESLPKALSEFRNSLAHGQLQALGRTLTERLGDRFIMRSARGEESEVTEDEIRQRTEQARNTYASLLDLHFEVLHQRSLRG
jgi:hypothetical protein